MRNPAIRISIAGIFILFGAVSCTVHPAGERDERDAAQSADKPFERPVESRRLPDLPNDATADQLVKYALNANAELEQIYWQWRSALDQIPQDATQATSLNVAAGTTLTRGQGSLSASTIALSNDPMTDIKWPGKLDAAGRMALENARAAGQRFRKAQFELRTKVLEAEYDYALTAELIRLSQSDRQLLKTIYSATQSRSDTGSAGQQDVLKAANDLDLSTNDIANMQSQLPAERAAINALLSRPSNAPLAPPLELPAARSIDYSDEQILALAARRNPDLQALADEVKSDRQGIRLAKLQYVPDFNFSVGTDLMGISQSVLGQASIPIFRFEAIEAGIAQARDNLKATQAMQRQMGNDLSARTILDLTSLRDAQRQLDLISSSILPRLKSMIGITREAYESGQASVLDLLDSHRALIDIQRLATNLRIVEAKRLTDLEEITCQSLTPETP